MIPGLLRSYQLNAPVSGAPRVSQSPRVFYNLGEAKSQDRIPMEVA